MFMLLGDGKVATEIQLQEVLHEILQLYFHINLVIVGWRKGDSGMQASVISLRCRYQTPHPGACPGRQSSTIPIVNFNQQNLAQSPPTVKSKSAYYWRSSSSSHSSKHKLYPKPPKSSADQYQLQSSYVWILINVINPQWSLGNQFEEMGIISYQ